jgi:hypothetical protein
MSKRVDILDGKQFGVWTAKYGLLYTCIALLLLLRDSCLGAGEPVRVLVILGARVDC